MNRPEEALHRAVALYLDLALGDGATWFHPANGGGRSRAEAGVLKALGVKSGVPDVMIVCAGRVFGIELKTNKGRLSPAQTERHAILRDAGCPVEIARSVDDVDACLRAWNIPTRARAA